MYRGADPVMELVFPRSGRPAFLVVAVPDFRHTKVLESHYRVGKDKTKDTANRRGRHYVQRVQCSVVEGRPLARAW